MMYILNPSKSFDGTSESILLDDGTVAYTEGMTLAEYEAERGFKPRLVSDFDLRDMMIEYEKAMYTAPVAITKERYWDMLEVLPPGGFAVVAGWEVFYVVERLYGNAVSWFANRNDRYVEFTNNAGISKAELAEILKGA